MQAKLISVLFVLGLGGLYWLGVAAIADKAEPWDAAGYWTVWYPCSMAIGAIAAVIDARLGWRAGAAMVGMQLPVMWVTTAPGALWLAGLLILGILAVPAMAISALGGALANRLRE